MTLAPADLVVNRVRLQAATSLAPGPARLRLESLLATLDTSTGLPPTSVVVVRRASLEVDLSGGSTVALGPSSLDVAALVRRGRRPSLADPAWDAEVVVFSDEADLLLSCTASLLQGRPLPWWYRALVRPSGLGPRRPATSIAELWQSRARALPAAAAANPPLVTSAANRLSTEEVLAVLAEMGEAHAAGSLVQVVRAQATTGCVPPASTSPPQEHPGPAEPSPWLAWLPPAADSDPRTAAVGTLVGTAIGLVRSPARARSAAYAEAVGEWLGRPPVRWVTPGPSPGGGGAKPTGTLTESSDPNLWHDQGDEPDDQAVPVKGPAASAVEERRRGATDRAQQAADRALRVPSPPVPPVAAGRPEQEPGAPLTTAAPHRFCTRLGGAFYLLSILELLDLPASAGEPGAPPPLTRWQVLELATRSLVTDPRDDGLWMMLAAVDGRRPDEAPGADIEELVFRFAPEWRSLLAQDPQQSGRLVAQRPAMIGPPLDEWARRLGDVVAALLAKGGLEPSVLDVPATIEVGPMHVVVEIPGRLVDLGVRRLGLDRDPGWVPELGRVVELRFP